MSTKDIRAGLRELVQGGNITQYSKEFYEFVKSIGDARTKQDEELIIQHEIKTLKNRMNSRDMQQKYMKEYLIRMLYVEMLGYEASFGHIHAVKMVSSRNLMEKRIGYLAVSLTLNKDHEFMMLLVNAFNNDLQSDNFIEACMSLHAIAKLVNVDVLPALMPGVVSCLKHKQALVRKKAVVCLQRFFQLQPASLLDLNEVVLAALCDPDPSVMAASLLLLKDVTQIHTQEYKMVIPSLVTILKQIVEHRLAHDYNYHRLPAPWIQMNILQLFSTLCHGDRKASELVFDLLSDVLRRAAVSSNIGYSIVYECIRTITNIYPNTALLQSAAEAVNHFLTSTSHNLKYLGLTSLAAIIQVDPRYAADHQLVVIDCLQSPDETLQRQTLELLFHMTNPDNVQAIVATMVKHLKLTVNSLYRSDLCCKILDLCDAFAPDGAWYVLTVSQVYEIGGADIPQHKTYGVINFLTSLIDDNDEAQVQVRQGLTNEFISKLQAADSTLAAATGVTHSDDADVLAALDSAKANEIVRIPDCFMKTIAWVLGEFGVTSGFDGIDIIDLLTERLTQTYLDSSVRHWILRAIIRVLAQLPESQTLPTTTLAVIDNAKQSQDVILQQIALEMSALYQHRAFLKHVLVQPTLALEVDAELSFLNPLVNSALAAGACNRYLPNYLHSHVPDKGQPKSSLRFEAYENVTPVQRVTVPSHILSATNEAGAAGGSNGPNDGPEVPAAAPKKIRLGGKAKAWGPKGFANPNALKSDSGASANPEQDANNMFRPESEPAAASSAAPADTSGIGSGQAPVESHTSGLHIAPRDDVFDFKPKPRVTDTSAQKAQAQRKQQAAKGLFAGLNTGGAGASTSAATTATPAASTAAAPAQKASMFKTGVSLKRKPAFGAAAKKTEPVAAAAPTPVGQASAAAPAPAAAAPAGGALDLLFGAASSAPAPAPTPKAAPANNADDLNALLFGNSTPASPRQPSTTSPQAPTGGNVFDIFAATSSPTATPAAPAAAANPLDLFGLSMPSAANNSQPLRLGLQSNLSTLGDHLGITPADIASVAVEPLPGDRNGVSFAQQVFPSSSNVVIWIDNTAHQTEKYVGQTVKVQVRSSAQLQLNTQQCVLIDTTSQQIVTGSVINTILTFTLPVSAAGLGSLALLLTPQAFTLGADISAQTIQLGVTIGQASPIPLSLVVSTAALLAPFEIATKQYAQYWKTFGSRGECVASVPLPANVSNESIVAALRAAHIHPVQTIKKETIAATTFIGQNGTSATPLLLHVKIAANDINLHARCNISKQLAQEVIDAFKAQL